MAAESCRYEENGVVCGHSPTHARGWCERHYRRWQRHGSPAINLYAPELVADRFWAKVDKDGPIATLRPDLGRCWLWTASTLADGYGRFSVNRVTEMAHRVAYEWLVGPIPELPGTWRTELDHFACERPQCVNPTHVRPVSQWENVLRGNGPSSLNKAKEYCIRGHPYDEVNTRWYRGGRCCRVCEREREWTRVRG